MGKRLEAGMNYAISQASVGSFAMVTCTRKGKRKVVDTQVLFLLFYAQIVNKPSFQSCGRTAHWQEALVTV